MMRLIFIPLYLLFSLALKSQGPYNELIKTQFKHWDIQGIDPNSLKLKDHYTTLHNGATHFYFVQTFQGYEIAGTYAAVHLSSDKKPVYSNHHLIDFPESVIKDPRFYLQYNDAIIKVANVFNIPLEKSAVKLMSEINGIYTIQPKGLAKQPIIAKKVIAANIHGQFKPVWEVAIDLEKSPDFWNVFIDAETGELIGKNNWTVYCSPGNLHETTHNHPLHLESLSSNTIPSSYLVFPIEVESPDHGDRKLIIHSLDSLASPFGWHDVDGQPGPEFTYTRGNNVHAFLDRDADDEPDELVVDGGKDLKFVFPFTKTSEHYDIQEASVTQLFYSNNYLHDFAYHYGFDEKSGNFQQNNYNKGGKGGDPIMANAQDGAMLNNANFTAPPDGMKGRMQMFLWGNQTGKLLKILSPSSIAGSMEARQAGFGGELTRTPIQGEIVLAIDNTSNPTLGCGTLINPSQFVGKIVLFDRGECQFGDKALKAQVVGAKAVIIVNNEDELVAMGAGNSGNQVSIPVIMIRKIDGDRIKQFLIQGVTAEMVIDTSNPPFFKDSGFDNGIVIHEYGHGISIRLTGGPSNSDCLTNDEQMGEGWSDFFTLVLTNPFGQNGNEIDRGIGTFTLGQKIDEKGLRRKKYSTENLAAGHTYFDILGTTTPHPLGEVWTALLWDLYWEMSKKHGWDDDLMKGNGGNNLALQLVMDGMKLQNCHPGFIDGRDAIIAADILNNNGENECLIWDVFAKRGFGWSSDQGSSFNRNDGKAAFDTKPECSKSLKIEKIGPASVQRGQQIQISLLVSNHKETAAKNVFIEDILPPGFDFVEGSERGPAKFSKSGNRLLFEIDQMRSGTSLALNYEVYVNPEKSSIVLFSDNPETDPGKMIAKSLVGSTNWKHVSDTWQIANGASINDQVLETAQSIRLNGLRPMMRFMHSFNTEPYYDGGRIEWSLDQSNWTALEDEIYKNEYTGPISPTLFRDVINTGYYGKNQEFEEVRADLSFLKDKQVFLRYRFASNENNATARESVEGWKIRKIQILDAEFLQSAACISDSEDKVCADFPHRGILIEPQTLTSTNRWSPEEPSWTLYPNPSNGAITMHLDLSNDEFWQMEIINPQGALLELMRGQGNGFLYKNLPKGMYFLKLHTEKGISVKKLIIH
jgi:extracellular elastinolytic metalloproteinase